MRGMFDRLDLLLPLINPLVLPFNQLPPLNILKLVCCFIALLLQVSGSLLLKAIQAIGVRWERACNAQQRNSEKVAFHGRPFGVPTGIRTPV